MRFLICSRVSQHLEIIVDASLLVTSLSDCLQLTFNRVNARLSLQHTTHAPKKIQHVEYPWFCYRCGLDVSLSRPEHSEHTTRRSVEIVLRVTLIIWVHGLVGKGESGKNPFENPAEIEALKSKEQSTIRLKCRWKPNLFQVSVNHWSLWLGKATALNGSQ